MSEDAAAPSDAMLALAERLADASRAVARHHFRTPVSVDDKADATPVTIADREAEQAMRRIIEQTHPDHGIIGEEFGRERDDAEWVWVLDPIDGTKQFVTGKPTFGSLIALTHRAVPVLGVIEMPAVAERWLGAKGRPTLFLDHHGEHTVETRPCPALAQASFATTSHDLYDGGTEREGYRRLREQAKLTYYGGDCHNYGLLAAGYLDLAADPDMSYYDFAALVPVVEGAGGRITDWRGNPLHEGGSGRVIAAGDPRLHAEALEVLAS
jgi:histidinol phosphatase-like enzyme (inositol monophosphatase family)